MNEKNGNEDGLSNGEKLRFYPVSEVDCGLNYAAIFSTYVPFQQLTKSLSSLHTS